jgi:ankyrin repeat protein
VRNVIAELETYHLRRIIYDPVDTKSFEYLTKLNSSLVCRLRQSGTDWAVGYGKYRATNHIHDQLKGTCSPETVFLFAAGAGLDEIVRSLLFDPTTSTTLTQNARTLTRVCDRQDSTALHLAVSGNRVNMVRSLLDAEADVLAADNVGSTPLQLLLSSSRTFLFGRRQFPSAAGTSRRWTARQIVVEEDFRHLDLEFWNLVMRSVFTNHGSTIEGSNKFELSGSVKNILGPAVERLIGAARPQKALFQAVKNNHEYFVRALLECHDIVNAPQDGMGSKDTGIVVAVQTSNTRMMEVLESYGADINIENKDGQIPLWIGAKLGSLTRVT